MHAVAQSPLPLIAEKKVARLGPLELACGRALPEVAVGYETYGQLDERAGNAILVCHFFSGCSHAAGRYRQDDPLPGWWDAVIGPGKAIDTERWFVVAIDALGCMRTDTPQGVTTSPTSLDPSTGKPYGPTFPPIAVADMVAAQRRVLDQLGVGKLAAVVGPSMGAIQALEWAARRPAEVGRVVAAIGLERLQPREVAFHHTFEDLIRLDPAFRGGHYAPGAELPGLVAAMKLLVAWSSGAAFAPPTADLRTWLEREARSRASVVDANALIGLVQTVTSWRLEGPIAAPVLLLPSADDAMLPPERYHTPMADALRAAGTPVSTHTLPAGHGHLGGLAAIAHAADAIRQHLEAGR